MNRPLFVVIATVVLNLVAAAVLKYAALSYDTARAISVLAVITVLGIQGGRFLLWGYAHRRWPLSHTYPLSAIFFPLILALGVFYGEPVTIKKLVGAILITVSVAWIAKASEGNASLDV